MNTFLFIIICRKTKMDVGNNSLSIRLFLENQTLSPPHPAPSLLGPDRCITDYSADKKDMGRIFPLQRHDTERLQV